MKRGVILAVGLVGTGFVSQALAQLAPPPTPAPEKSAPYVPAPKRDVPTLPPPAPKEPSFPLPEWEKDSGGKLVQVQEPVWWASLRKNQLLGPADWAKITPYLAKRKRVFEKAVIDNADLLRQVLGGALEKIDQAKRSSIAEQLKLLKPLNADVATHKDMRDRGLLTQTQTQHNEKIGKSYREQRRKELEETDWKLPPDATAEQKAKVQHEKMKYTMFQNFIEESMWAYEGLLNEGGEKLDAVLAKVNLDAETKGKIAPMAAAAKSAKDKPARVKAMRELATQLSVDQERDLLKAVQSMRPPVKEEATFDDEDAKDAAKPAGDKKPE